MASGRVGAALTANVAAHRHGLATKGASLRHRLLTGAVEVKSESLSTLARRLDAALSANVAARRHGVRWTPVSVPGSGIHRTVPGGRDWKSRRHGGSDTYVIG